MRVGTPVVGTADGLTKTVTAFGSFGEFKKAMDGGYVPTLRESGTNGRPTKLNREQDRWNLAVRSLRKSVKDAGYRYFDGRKVV